MGKVGDSMNCLMVYLSIGDLPKPMIVTISISVLAVVLLAVFVFNMWRHQERTGDIAREVQRITNHIGAGIVNYLPDGDGYITYGSKGFYELMGYTSEELSDKFDKRFYKLLEDKYAQYLRTLEVDDKFYINEEMIINTKSGPKWVLVTGNSVYNKSRIYSVSMVMMDITKEKMLNEKLRLDQERYRLVTELSNDVIFNYEIDSDRLVLSESFNEFYYNGDSEFEGFARRLLWKNGFIYEEDMEKFAELFRILTIKGDNVDEQIRIRNLKNEYVWSRLIAMTVRGQEGELKEIVGKLINIDLHKKELARLEKKAMRDPLTGAYNKEYTKLLINRYIDENPNGAGMLLIVDIDKFKNINDTYGHIMGDNIIIEVVRQISKAFRSNDIIGRIGGDEFVVFLCNVFDPENQLKQAKRLHEVLRMPAVIGNMTVNKSASIGVAMFPEHGSNYEELVGCADKALYAVKGSGRDNFIIYNETMANVQVK